MKNGHDLVLRNLNKFLMKLDVKMRKEGMELTKKLGYNFKQLFALSVSLSVSLKVSFHIIMLYNFQL